MGHPDTWKVIEAIAAGRTDRAVTDENVTGAMDEYFAKALLSLRGDDAVARSVLAQVLDVIDEAPKKSLPPFNDNCASLVPDQCQECLAGDDKATIAALKNAIVRARADLSGRNFVEADSTLRDAQVISKDVRCLKGEVSRGPLDRIYIGFRKEVDLEPGTFVTVIVPKP